MRRASLNFLKTLIETPSPSGYEAPIQNVTRKWAKQYADSIETDVHGNVIAALNPEGHPRLMFAGHCDQIGFMVQHIDDNGFLRFNPIGGHDVMVLIGQNVTVWGTKTPVPGVIARKPIHLLHGEDELKKVPRINDLWIDIGAKSKKEASDLIEVGDAITFGLSMTMLQNNTVVGPAMDNKVGVWAVMEALRLLSGRKFDAAIFFVSTVQEEVGLRGATTSSYSIAPDAGLAVDVTFATDHPDIDHKLTGEVHLHKGPVIYRGPNINPRIYEILSTVAKSKKIPFQPAGAARPTGTDANAIQLARGGVATGLISVPNRYMHSPVEMVSLPDLDNTAKLFAEFALTAEKGMDFIP